MGLLKTAAQRVTIITLFISPLIRDVMTFQDYAHHERVCRFFAKPIRSERCAIRMAKAFLKGSNIMLKTRERSWEWSPPASMNSGMSALLRIPFLHRLVSKRLALLSFAGRKSGHHYDIPVGYSRQGNTVTILTKRFRIWWRNFQAGAPVDVWLEGKLHHGEVKAITDEARIVPIMAKFLTDYPSDAEFYGIQFLSPGNPDMEGIRRFASKVVVLSITLTAPR